ncbi:transglycosylase family protein [Streptomyces sp. NPDC059582]|uniref:transglycosylase family protein n=1 Tax=Streptomyces sp. NPDC059582 TaxID=3346875 RepID=UPI003691D44D
MLSGNGRHRRPRQAPALLVAAGVTGSAIAIPLLAATGASAAESSTWDQVAQCETGGSWSADTGNGYYGGLHLSQDDWERYGGLDYASRADLASRSQQIAVAEKVLADQGVEAWSTCGLLSGLAKDSVSANIDTGVLGDSSGGSSDSSDSPSLSDSLGLSGSSGEASGGPSAQPSGEATGVPSILPSGEPSSSTPSSGATGAAGSDGASDSGADDAGRGAGSSTDGARGGDSDNSRQAIGSSGLVDTGALSVDTGAPAADTGAPAADASGTGRHRGGSADEQAADAADAFSFVGRHASTAYATAGS